ncbi:MAG TPA: hypothetical protein ENK02_11325 [Planctomycetes bacterium]|nr:hypothetical protein [Planctomycetota bacterium]
MNAQFFVTLSLAAASVSPLCSLSAQVPNGKIALETRIRKIANNSHGLARVFEIGKTRSGAPILALAIQKETPGRRNRPALLLVAGLDGRRTQDSEVALEIAKEFVNQKADTLKGRILQKWTLFVIPCANRDGQGAKVEGNLGPVDEDRDGQIDEDGPEDLDGDGRILWMRKKDPEGTYIQDPKSGRMRKADPEKGEAGIYKVWREGKDNDGDGEFNEDPPGGIVPNRNFPHLYPEHGEGAGPYVLSEPESRSLAEFVIQHPRIRAVITLGAFDNLSGKAKRNTAARNSPINGYEPRDKAALASFAKAIKRKGNQGSDEWPGRFHAWVYAHAGRTSLALRIGKKKTKKSPPKSPSSKPAKKKKKDLEPSSRAIPKPERKKIFPWRPFNHPQLGPVEIGGKDPLEDSKYSAEEQSKGVLLVSRLVEEVYKRACDLRIVRMETKALGNGAMELRAVVRNEGKEASRTAIADRLRNPRQPRLEFVRYSRANPLSSKRWDKSEAQNSLLTGRPFVFIPTHLLLGQTSEFRWILKKPKPGTLGLRIVQEGFVFDIKEVK